MKKMNQLMGQLPAIFWIFIGTHVPSTRKVTSSDLVILIRSSPWRIILCAPTLCSSPESSCGVLGSGSSCSDMSCQSKSPRSSMDSRGTSGGSKSLTCTLLCQPIFCIGPSVLPIAVAGSTGSPGTRFITPTNKKLFFIRSYTKYKTKKWIWNFHS